MASAKTRARLLLGLCILLALAFLASGGSKLANADSSSGLPFGQQFVAWGYPAWARFVVGAAEVAGAIGLLVPATRFYASGSLTLLMLGAITTHLRVGEAAYAPFPLALGLLTATVAWASRPERLPFTGSHPAAE
ncbi:MAG: DoxX family protein [Thermoplasmatota archaeon]